MKGLPAFACVFLLIAVAAAWPVTAASASPVANASSESQDDADDCLFCHAADDLYLTLPDGSVLSLMVDRDELAGSVHGRAGLTCTDCHLDYDGYPHPPSAAASLTTNLRDYQVARYTICQTCHEDQYEAQLDSMHQRALAGGRPDAAICTDCHGAHDVTSPGDPPSRIPRTCGRCHMTTYDDYKESVHGAALLDETNPDVPTCVDCHGVHSIADPLADSFRLASPEICAGCHADPERMAPYGISTDVVETYVADFHGTTVTLFESRSPEHPINEAVCFDCHGIHDIKQVDDPTSLVIREHLLATCQQCHPNATEHFPEAWASHYIPSPEHNPIVYYVGEFYATLLPTVGVLLAVVVGADVIGWLGRKIRGGESESP
jgi:hypothetical protein